MSEALIQAVSRLDVARYLQTLIYLYVALILVRVIMSYFRRIPYNRYLSAFLRFVEEVTNPYLGLFRRFIPPIRLGPAALDLTPVIATFALIVVGGIVVDIVAG
ncbi:MAG TPA: YggT family protein [Thermoleophilaceae bacterium]|nr:YggT family protein [Thermoleophilaceae bacterium]